MKKNKKIITIVGARPQFIKAAVVSGAIAKFNQKNNFLKEIIVHTGQHYDINLSDTFFRELCIPRPKYNLGVKETTHAAQTGRMLMGIERILCKEAPDIIIVYGDTNSTLAGALAAAKLDVPIAHVEAGLRSYNRSMPEEVNRVLTDRVSTLLFCPTHTAVNNLKKEGIYKGVYLVGDVMQDLLVKNEPLISRAKILSQLNLKPKGYILLTIHRQENTDNTENLKTILFALRKTKERIIFPVHPRTNKVLKQDSNVNLGDFRNILFIKPLSYLNMLALEKNAKKILTDSGGVQKEASWFGVPCITLRNETEWVETVRGGGNVLAGTDKDRIVECVRDFKPVFRSKGIAIGPTAADKIVSIIASFK